MRIILLLADALRSDHLSCYNGKVQTPNIDSLAQHGIRFENFFSNSNATEPCITTILTGHYPRTHGILQHPRVSTFEEVEKQRISETAENSHICTKFHENAYKTILVDNMSIFNRVYFDDYIEVPEGLRSPDNAEITTEIARHKLENAPEDCFMFIHYWNTHHPYFPSYPGEVAKLDVAIGKLIKYIENNDIVIFTADHGESIGEHITKARADDPGHHHLYDEIIHIPLIISPADPTVNTNMREQIDLAPTILDLAHIKHEGLFSKRSISLDKNLNKSEVYLEEHTYQEQLGIRTVSFKFMEKLLLDIKCPLCNVIHGNARYEFYNLKNDPKEMFNLAPFHTLETLIKFDMHLKDWMAHSEL